MKKLVLLVFTAIAMTGCIEKIEPAPHKYEIVHHGNIHDTISTTDDNIVFYVENKIFRVKGVCAFTDVEYFKRID